MDLLVRFRKGSSTGASSENSICKSASVPAFHIHHMHDLYRYIAMIPSNAGFPIGPEPPGRSSTKLRPPARGWVLGNCTGPRQIPVLTAGSGGTSGGADAGPGGIRWRWAWAIPASAGDSYGSAEEHITQTLIKRNGTQLE